MSSEIADTYGGKTILISGARGYIGSALVRFLSDIDCKLKLLGRSENTTWLPQQQRAEISLLHSDVSKRETWEYTLPGVDYVFHLAASERRGSAYDTKFDLQVNALSVLNLLDVLRENDARTKIINASSSNLFGLVDAWPVNENNRDNPPSLWSAHKLLAENYLRVYAQQFGVKSVSLRLANVYGPTINKDVTTNVIINKMIAKALLERSLTLYSNQNCVRDFLFIDDVLQAFLLAGVENRLLFDGHFYVVGSGEEKTFAEAWRLIADKVSSCTGKNVTIEFDSSVKMTPLDMRNFVSDSKVFSQATGWKPQVSMEKGIELTVEALMSMF